MPIESFGDRETETFWRTGRSRRFPPDIQARAKRKLQMIDQAVLLHDVGSSPGSNLERLVADRAGQHSIRINDQWRICFRHIEPNHFHDVSVVDYH